MTISGLLGASFLLLIPEAASARQWVLLDPRTDFCTITPIDGNPVTQSPLSLAKAASAHGWTVSFTEARYLDDPVPGEVSEIDFTAKKPGKNEIVVTFWTSLAECNEREAMAKQQIPEQDLQ